MWTPVSDRLFGVRASGTLATIDEFNLTTGAVINSFPAPAPIQFPGSQGLCLGTNSLFYIDGSGPGPYCLWELNPNTGAVISHHSINPGVPIDGLGYLNGKVYMQDVLNNEILVFDPVAGKVTGILPVAAGLRGGLTGAGQMNMLSGMLLASSPGGTIYVINPTTGVITNSYLPDWPAHGTSGLAYINGELVAQATTDPNGYQINPWGEVFDDPQSAVACVINPKNGAILSTVPLGGTGYVTALGGDGASASLPPTSW